MSNISIKNPEFHDMAVDLDWAMQNAILKMERTGTDEAKVTLTVDIMLNKRYEGKREYRQTEFQHEVKSSVQVKASKKGRMEGEYELVFDRETRGYCIRPVEDGQMEMEMEE